MNRFRSLVAVAAMVSGIVVLAPQASGATSPGIVTSTTVTVPAELSGLTPATTTSSRDGGIYYAYKTSGGDLKIFKTKPDGTQETSFGVSGIADVPGVVPAISGSSLRTVIASVPDGKWFAASQETKISSFTAGDVRVIGGGATGAPTIDYVVSYSALQGYCDAAYPSYPGKSSWYVVTSGIVAGRGTRVWLYASCLPLGSGGLSTVADGRVALIAYSATGTREASVPVVGADNLYGSTSDCTWSGVISDPTGAADSPEVYVLRTESTYDTGSCRYPGRRTAADITAYSILKVASDGTVSRWGLASSGDSSDGVIAGRIDPGGRLVLVNTNLADSSKLTLRRVNTDGTLDTSVGTSGVVTIDIGAAPAGQSTVTASVTGIITTASKVYFAILLSDQKTSGAACGSTSAYQWGFRYTVASPADGILSSFGTAGVGDRTIVNDEEGTPCISPIFTATSVDTDGQPRGVRNDNDVLKLDVWGGPTGANGGGEGGTGSGGPTTDTGGAPSQGDGLQVINPSPTTTLGSGSSTTVPSGSSTTVPSGSSTTVPSGSSTTVPSGSSTTVPSGSSTTVPSGSSTTVPSSSTTVPTGSSSTFPSGSSTTTAGGGSGSGGSGAQSVSGVTFNSLPSAVQTNSAVKIVAKAGGRKVTYRSETPTVCASASMYVLAFKSGVCRVNVYVGSRLVKRIRFTVGANASAVGSPVETIRLLFNGQASKITKVAIAQMNAVAAQLRSSPLVIALGHTNNDGGPFGSPGSMHLSMRRAAKVVDFVRGLGARNVAFDWYGNTRLASLVKRSENRRVDLVWIAD